MKKRDREEITNLEEIPNIGKAIGADLRSVGITNPQQLIGKDAFKLYDTLCKKKGERVDHCVIDVFLAAIDFMQGGNKQPWWAFTAERKKLLNES